jgi:hypothetical protein
VEDETRSATFVMFDKDAYTLLNKTCAELVNSVKKVKTSFVTLFFFIGNYVCSILIDIFY